MENASLHLQVLLPFAEAAGGNTQIERLVLAPGEKLPLAGYPEERLYLVLGGYGALSVYGAMGKGDLYQLRPSLTLYFTPGLLHELENTGSNSMELILFRVTGGLVPDGAMEGVQKWTTIGKSKTVGCGFWYTDLYNLAENETAREGLTLQVWGVGLRRPQKIDFAELCAEAPGGATRMHAHANTHEHYYVVQGRGDFFIGERKLSLAAGNVTTVPAETVHHMANTGSGHLVCLALNTAR